MVGLEKDKCTMLQNVREIQKGETEGEYERDKRADGD